MVNPEIIKWSIERKGLTLKQAKSNFPKISEWIDGEATPTYRQLQSLSRVTSVPLGYFFLQDIPKMNAPIPHYRTDSSSGVSDISIDLYDTIMKMKNRQDWLSHFLSEEGVEELNFIGSINLSMSVDKAVNNIRKIFGINEKWYEQINSVEDSMSFFKATLESKGVFVMGNSVVGLNNNRKLDPDEFKGFVLIDNYAPIVFINTSDWKAAQLFTLVHEIVHLFIGHSASFSFEQLGVPEVDIERYCNKVAAALLVPNTTFKKECENLYKLNINKKVNRLSKLYKVSKLVISRRAFDLKKITWDQYDNYYKESVKSFQKAKIKLKNKSGGGDFYLGLNNKLSSKFAKTVGAALSQDKIRYTDASNLTDLKPDTFQKYLKKVGS